MSVRDGNPVDDSDSGLIPKGSRKNRRKIQKKICVVR